MNSSVVIMNVQLGKAAEGSLYGRKISIIRRKLNEDADVSLIDTIVCR